MRTQDSGYREPTGLDTIADLVIHRSIGQTLSDAVGLD
jgi:hypothetical protein